MAMMTAKELDQFMYDFNQLADWQQGHTVAYMLILVLNTLGGTSNKRALSSFMSDIKPLTMKEFDARRRRP